MVVCHCLRINDRVIAHFTADPTITAQDITRECGAGGRCGGCVEAIEEMLLDARSNAALDGTPLARPRRRRLVSAA
jgi:bacterioferritin-associated ferredoxin